MAMALSLISQAPGTLFFRIWAVILVRLEPNTAFRLSTLKSKPASGVVAHVTFSGADPVFEAFPRPLGSPGSFCPWALLLFDFFMEFLSPF